MCFWEFCIIHVISGISPQVTYLDQDSSTISVYDPVSSVSTDSRSEFVSNQKEIQPEETNRQSKKVNYGRGGKLMAGIFSPGSASPLRRSSRSKVSSNWQSAWHLVSWFEGGIQDNNYLTKIT